MNSSNAKKFSCEREHNFKKKVPKIRVVCPDFAKIIRFMVPTTCLPRTLPVELGCHYNTLASLDYLSIEIAPGRSPSQDCEHAGLGKGGVRKPGAKSAEKQKSHQVQRIWHSGYVLPSIPSVFGLRSTVFPQLVSQRIAFQVSRGKSRCRTCRKSPNKK